MYIPSLKSFLTFPSLSLISYFHLSHFLRQHSSPTYPPLIPQNSAIVLAAVPGVSYGFSVSILDLNLPSRCPCFEGDNFKNLS